MLKTLFANESGEIFEAPYSPSGQVWQDIEPLKADELIPLPEGAEIMFLPERYAYAYKGKKLVTLPGESYVVAAMLPAGYTRTHLPAYLTKPGAPDLPLFGYAAVAVQDGQVFVAALKSDENHKWNPVHYNTADLAEKVEQVKAALPNNRLVEHLGHCSLTWHCCTAQNLFYRRWEAGLPVSSECNAHCLGCISLQEAECCPSPQSRITFKPTVAEIAEIGVYHLANAPEGIISFGQGCEGDPTLAYTSISEAMGQIRQQTEKGLINMNSNAGFTKGLKAIVDAGLDTLRVSMISARDEVYQAYYRAAYSLEDVKASILYAKEKGVYVSINMLLYPGLNDRPEELAAWRKFLDETKVDMIQLRNLNFDPESLTKQLPPPEVGALGIRSFVNTLEQLHPHVVLGSFSHYIEKDR